LQQQLKEQQQQQQQVIAQQFEAMQPQHQLQLPAVVKEGGRAVGDEAPRAGHAVQQLQQPADPSAALLGALAAAGQEAAAADLHDALSQLQGGEGVTEEVLALVPQQLLQQGPSALVEQLHQYMQLQQRLESIPNQQQVLSTALGATAHQLQQHSSSSGRPVH
ncbi:hypothetical protein COO60DRAFT_1497086, partial [Scenedesmus sp. NREL 46B-D3]